MPAVHALCRRLTAAAGIAICLLVWYGQSTCFAQPGGEGRRGRFPSPDEFLQRMDTNSNGMLDGDEMEGRARFMIERMAEGTELDTSQPIPIDKLREAMQQRMQARSGPRGSAAPSAGRGGREDDDDDDDSDRGPGRGWGGRGGPGGGWGGPGGGWGGPGGGWGGRGGPGGGWGGRGNRQPGDDEASGEGQGDRSEDRGGRGNWGWGGRRGRGGDGDEQQTPTKPLVPGFGVEASGVTVPGFGIAAMATPAAAAASAPTVGGPSTGEGSSSTVVAAPVQPPPTASEQREKVARYAESMLKQNDSNADGSLQRDEWSKMNARHHGADTDGDGVITKDELTDRLVSYSQPASGGGDRGASGGSAASAGRKTYRFRTPAERLPAGLPEWFRPRDANGDGQVAMSEFSGSWTAAKAAEFARYDTNGDGIVTAQEGAR